VHLLVSLHIVALGDHLSYGILVTLGGCHYLDGLEAAEELWQVLVIVLGHLPVIIRGTCAFPSGVAKTTLVDCVCR
jgi:hypothetical protein